MLLAPELKHEMAKVWRVTNCKSMKYRLLYYTFHSYIMVPHVRRSALAQLEAETTGNAGAASEARRTQSSVERNMICESCHYVFVKRAREREREIYIYIYINLSIYIYIYIHRYKQMSIYVYISYVYTQESCP